MSATEDEEFITHEVPDNIFDDLVASGENRLKIRCFLHFFSMIFVLDSYG